MILANTCSISSLAQSLKIVEDRSLILFFVHQIILKLKKQTRPQAQVLTQWVLNKIAT